MIPKIKITGIKWDTDGAKVKGLKKSLTVKLTDIYDNIADDISEWLSDKFGYCHEGFRYDFANGRKTRAKLFGVQVHNDNSANPDRVILRSNKDDAAKVFYTECDKLKRMGAKLKKRHDAIIDRRHNDIGGAVTFANADGSETVVEVLSYFVD